MHCSDEALINNDSEQTREHLRQCGECQQRLWQLKRLQTDANKLPLHQPSELAWDKIKASLPSQQPVKHNDNVVSLHPQTIPAQAGKPRRVKLPLMIAASFALGGLVTLLSNQMWQVNALDQQIALSRQYEQQLVALQLTSPMVENQLWQISQIDQQLNQAKSEKQRQQLWLQRNKLLKQILEQSNTTSEMI
jgi:hypothetical protein